MKVDKRFIEKYALFIRDRIHAESGHVTKKMLSGYLSDMLTEIEHAEQTLIEKILREARNEQHGTLKTP